MGLESELVYLAVVLDAHSRRAMGWAPDRTLEGHLAIAALQMTLRRRSPTCGARRPGPLPDGVHRDSGPRSVAAAGER
jgi:transposase InsO family protein